MVNGVTTGQEISDQWACWGLSFLFRSIYSVETKMGQTFMTWLILQHFLVHFCYFEAFTGRQAEPSQRRVRHTVRTEHRTHKSESGVNAAATHVWKTTYNRGTHTVNRWRLQHITINLQLHHRTAAQRPTLAHTQTKTALTSFSSSSV